MQGRSPLEVFPPDLGASYEVQDQLVIANGLAIHNQLELHLSASRKAIWCLTHKIPLRDHNDQVIGLAGISRDLPMPDRDHPIYQRIAVVVQHIQQNFGESLKLEELAQIARLSPAQLERHILRIFELTPKQLIIKTRIEAATILLKESTSVADIAYACGYSDHSAFSRQFKAIVGISPTQYREMYL
jgi:AraC-like DNA-binding protein